MLKTKFSKAAYLCLFCFFTSSFLPRPRTVSAVYPTAEETERSAFAINGKDATLSAAPKVKLNKQELQFANHYIKSSAECLAMVKERSKVPFTIIDSVFTHYGLPLQLRYLAVIESELKPSALSCVGALGPWQLMPETAHDLGLKVTRKYDERTNYYKSTVAAAKYLKDLYAEFGDWLLVLAAYNGGPKPIYTAMHKSGSRNFWALQEYLPAETRGHVKRFIATHYYFEGQGSVTTLTKAEAKKLIPASFVPASQVIQVAQVVRDSRPVSSNPPAQPVEHKESKEEQFSRLMKESEESLQKANKVIEG